MNLVIGALIVVTIILTSCIRLKSVSSWHDLIPMMVSITTLLGIGLALWLRERYLARKNKAIQTQAEVQNKFPHGHRYQTPFNTSATINVGNVVFSKVNAGGAGGVHDVVKDK